MFTNVYHIYIPHAIVGSDRYRGTRSWPFSAQIREMSQIKMNLEFIAIIYDFKQVVSVMLDITDVHLCNFLS